jgi:hypothetical protein
MGIPRGVRRGGMGGLVILVIVVLISTFFGGEGGSPVQDVPSRSAQSSYSPQAPQRAGNEQLRDFVSVVLADTEDTWQPLFRQMNRTYQEPTLVLFSDQVRSACGFASTASGPFYCPMDQKVYIDLSFYQELRNRLGAPGDFAQAYVIAHEIGHHVQNQLGILPKVHELRGRVSESEGNQLSVMLELQADCFSGVWAHHAQRARNILEAGDIEEGLNAASAVGDDRLQKQSRGYVTPDSFTHGSSTQRVAWFKKGLQTGNLAACDTFNAARL